jgi:hypothetical protein
MGVAIEFNPDLALRNISEFKAGRRKIEECIPEKIQENEIYPFLKSGQRNYWLEKEIPLVETKGNCDITRPLASVKIIEETHFIENHEQFTKGKYLIAEIFNDKKVHFEGLERVKE